MEDVQDLQHKIQKLESDHKAYVQFGAGCFIGILAAGMMIDHLHAHYLWFVIVLLTFSLIAIVVTTVKKDMEKDQYESELKSLTSNPAQGSIQ